MKKIDIDIEKEAIDIVKNEKTTYEEATAFITENVAFRMRNLIRQCRKNYWGVFENPVDETTGHKKTWIPLTESTVEGIVKNIDLDTKDINFRAKQPDAIGMTAVIRNLVKDRLDNMFFGEYLDQLERQLAIDGTVVWKTLEGYDDLEKKKCMQIRYVDLLNVYIDPTVNSIQEAYRFTERAVLDEDQVKSMDGWINTEEVTGSAINRIDADYNQSVYTEQSTDKLIDVYEMWGKIPKSLITGKGKDKDIEIDGHIVVSGIDNAGKELVHLIEENKSGLKPYEEAWYTRIAGRWYGKGVAEKLVMLQLWQNMIVNMRINKARVNQLGLFKIRKGSGVTPQMVARLASNGAIMVNNMQDIEQWVMQEAGQASYNDEGVIDNWASKLTSAFEAVTGEAMPSSTTATATAIQARAGQSAFVLIKEEIGMFLQRWLKRHAVPLLLKTTKKDDIIRLTGENSELQDMDDKLVNYLIKQKLEKITKEGKFVNPAEVAQQKQMMTEKMQTSGSDRFIKLVNDINPTLYDVQVYVTNEEIDKGILAQNLMGVLQLAPEYKDIVVKQIFDIMGLDTNRLRAKEQMMPEMVDQPQPPQGGKGMPQLAQMTQNPQELTTNANTI